MWWEERSRGNVTSVEFVPRQAFYMDHHPSRRHCFSHFIEEETEAWGGSTVYLSLTDGSRKLGFELGSQLQSPNPSHPNLSSGIISVFSQLGFKIPQPVGKVSFHAKLGSYQQVAVRDCLCPRGGRS